VCDDGIGGARGGDTTVASGDPRDCVDEALDIVHTLLEQVADPVGALPDQVQRVPLLVVLRQHQHPGVAG
jgi:hypothetical protein